MSRTISPSGLSSHSAHMWGSEGGSRAHCGPLIARRGSGASRPSLHVDGARPGWEGVVYYACDAFIYIDATGCGALHDRVRSASRHGMGRFTTRGGRFMSRRLAPWQAAQRRAGLGEHRRCTGRGLRSGAEYRSALRVDPRRRPLIITCFGFDALGPLFC